MRNETSQAARKGETPSLLERAAEIYDFSSGLLVQPLDVAPPRPAAAQPPIAAPVSRRAEPQEPIAPPVRRTPAAPRPSAEIDRGRLRAAGILVPSASSALAEEIRLVKRQLLAAAATAGKGVSEEKRRSILVCSAQPGEGKTFTALNLAISLAAEQDREVLLVDGDFQKPEILSLLGLESGPGLVDALADPAVDVESLVVRTDLGNLSVLPAGRQADNVPELLASARTARLLASLAADPRRLVLFDSPPLLMASAASLLASHVGQALVVVRADRTTESDLGEAVGLLADCAQIGLVLNGAGFAAGRRRYGQYYGYEP